jgi:hypothetical protein
VEIGNVAGITEIYAALIFWAECVRILCKYSILFQKTKGTRRKGGDWLFFFKQDTIYIYIEASCTSEKSALSHSHGVNNPRMELTSIINNGESLK